MKFIKEHKLLVILVSAILIAAVLIGFFAARSQNGRPSAAEDAVKTAASPLQRIITNIGDGIYDLTHCFSVISDLRNENSQLKAENAELEQVETNEELEAENRRLRQMLELRTERAEYELTAASVVANDPSNWYSTVTIDKGSKSGIDVEMPVVTGENFLVGKVTKVGTNWAEVTTLIDPSFSVGALVGDTKQLGIVGGDGELRYSYRCRASYLSRDMELSDGDLLTTSGLGGIFPSGITIGKLYDIGEDNLTASKYASVEPSANIRDLRDVFVITNNIELVAEQETDNLKNLRVQAEDEQAEIDGRNEEASATADPDSTADPDATSEPRSTSEPDEDGETLSNDERDRSGDNGEEEASPAPSDDPDSE